MLQVEPFSILQLMGERWPLQPLCMSETFYIQVINLAGFQYSDFSINYFFGIFFGIQTSQLITFLVFSQENLLITF